MEPIFGPVRTLPIHQPYGQPRTFCSPPGPPAEICGQPQGWLHLWRNECPQNAEPARKRPGQPRAKAALRRRWPRSSVQQQLEPGMGLDKPQPVIESMGVRTRIVAGQLHQRGAPPPGLFNSPPHHGRAESDAAQRLVHADSLNLHPRRAPARKSRQKRQLHSPRQGSLGRVHHAKQMGRICINCTEGSDVRLPFLRGRGINGGPQLIARRQLNDGPDVGRLRPAQRKVPACERKRRQHRLALSVLFLCHGPSLSCPRRQ